MTTENQNQDQTNSSNEGGEKLYAGKFKSVEDLEAGYKNAAVVYDENAKLKDTVEKLSKAPEQYITPEGVSFPEAELNEMKEVAKRANLSQAAFEGLAKEMQARNLAAQQQYENTRKEIGETTVSILQDYVKKHYPEKLHDSMLSKLIIDKEARASALAHREQLLNSAVGGMRSAGGSNAVTQEEVLKARAELEKAKTGGAGSKKTIELQNRYISLTKQFAAQKQRA